MRKFAIFLLVLGVAVITSGITRWRAFHEFVSPDHSSGDDDPRFFTADEHMLYKVIAGIILIVISNYFFERAKKSKKPTPPESLPQDAPVK